MPTGTKPCYVTSDKTRSARQDPSFIDLDGFKEINDRLGHDVGDQLLRQVAGRLVRCVREGDTVCRFGGDEFIVLMESFHSHEDVEVIAQRILRSMTPPIDLGTESVSLTASVGIALAS